MTQRNLILGVIAVIGFGGAAFMFARGGGGRPALADTARDYGVCLACQEQAWITHSAGERAPFKCPKCGAQAAYNLFYCFDCGKRFVPPLDRSNPDGPPRLPPIVGACAACGSRSVMGYVHEGMGEEPVGTAPLPKWP